jgi:hypothetical protein
MMIGAGIAPLHRCSLIRRSTRGAPGRAAHPLVWHQEKSMTKTRLIGRSAISGRFKSVKAARTQKNTSIVQRIKVTKKKGR